MKNKPDPAKLPQYSGEHLLYEITMLWRTARAIPSHAEETVEHDALLESFATHLRNLIEFLFFKSSGEYVRAEDFFDNPSEWKPTFAANWKKLHKRACDEINHLTTGRVDSNSPDKKWPISEILKQIEPVLKDFASHASKSRLSPKVVNIFQASASTDAALIATITNVSTHTPTAPFVIFLDNIWPK